MEKLPPAKPLLGDSAPFQSVLNAAALVAPTDAAVLIRGEPGAGKELLAYHIHQQSRRAGGPWTRVNRALVPEILARSMPWFDAARGGTLFLDGVSELSLDAQAKLLWLLDTADPARVPDEGQSIRVIAATNTDLSRRVASKRFREDLFHRINIVPLVLPPLRERLGDLAPLAHHFLEQAARRNQLAPARLRDGALAELARFPWPGNVRQLRGLCERLAIFHAGREISAGDLPSEFCATTGRAGADHLGPFVLPEGGLDFRHLERDLIGQALERADGNKSRAAKLLGLTRDTFLYRLKKFSILY